MGNFYEDEILHADKLGCAFRSATDATHRWITVALIRPYLQLPSAFSAVPPPLAVVGTSHARAVTGSRGPICNGSPLQPV
jgi:hypothetical protein